MAAARKIPKRAVRAKSGAKGTAATTRSVEKPLPLSESDASHQMRQPEELRRARIELKAARDRYAALYDFSPAGHLTLDTSGTIVEANLSQPKQLSLNQSH